MRLMLTSRVPEGAHLGRDVWKGANVKTPWLRAGTTISPRYREAMLSSGLHAVYVDDEFSDGIEIRTPVREDVRRQAAETVDHALTGMRGAIDKDRAFTASFVGDMANVAMMLAREIELRADEAGLAFGDLADADAYTFQHSIDVATLGMVIGHRLFTKRGWVDVNGRRRLDKIEDRLLRLGLGLLLHDVGKLTIHEKVLNKPGRLDPEEWELMKSHPVAGVNLLAGTNVSPLVSVVVRAHHERWDGTGYPDEKAGDAIHQFARIAAVADVFDAITSERPYKPAAPNSVGVRVIQEGRGTHFDPECVDVFLEVVAPFPPGTEVELSDGRRGVVVEVTEGLMDRPVVRLFPEPGAPADEYEEIALIDHPELTLSEISAAISV